MSLRTIAGVAIRNARLLTPTRYSLGVSNPCQHATSTQALKTLLRPTAFSPFQISQFRQYSSDHPDEISADEFHKKSDETMELILESFEILGEQHPDVDVELAQGVLSLYLPPNGSYVVNKQPPNKQIWWSSPLSGPKRFDLVGGKWVYLRDGSTLGDGLREETKLVTDSRGLPPLDFEGLDD